VLKNNLWAIARSTNIPRWQHNLEKMRADSREAYEWVEKLAPNTWIKAFFSDFPKCDVLLNNHSEVFKVMGRPKRIGGRLLRKKRRMELLMLPEVA
jgi:hypothetical protein